MTYLSFLSRFKPNVYARPPYLGICIRSLTQKLCYTCWLLSLLSKSDQFRLLFSNMFQKNKQFNNKQSSWNQQKGKLWNFNRYRLIDRHLFWRANHIFVKFKFEIQFTSALHRKIYIRWQKRKKRVGKLFYYWEQIKVKEIIIHITDATKEQKSFWQEDIYICTLNGFQNTAVNHSCHWNLTRFTAQHHKRWTT